MGVKKGSSDRGPCVYCGSTLNITSDHVPPKLIFPKPRPSDLITVPACRRCNSGAGPDEEYFLAVFMFTEAGQTIAGKQLWDRRLRSMYRKNRGLRKRMVNSILQVELQTKAGLYVGRRMAIELDHERLNRVVMKTARGLYYHEYGQALAAEALISCELLADANLNPPDVKLSCPVRMGTRDWPDIFEYRFNRTPEDPRGSVWMLRFYGRVYYWVATTPDEERFRRYASPIGLGL